MSNDHSTPGGASDNSDAASGSADNKGNTSSTTGAEDATRSGNEKNGQGKDDPNAVESDDSIHG